MLKVLAESPEAASWSSENLRQIACPTIAWIAEHRSEDIAGFLIGRIAADEFEILNLAVAPRCRRHGIASKLLKAALEFSKVSGCRQAYLEVRASNMSAISLYVQDGFTETGRRLRYYRFPEEDAVILFVNLEN